MRPSRLDIEMARRLNKGSVNRFNFQKQLRGDDRASLSRNPIQIVHLEATKLQMQLLLDEGLFRVMVSHLAQMAPTGPDPEFSE